MTTLTLAKLDEIEAAAAKATPGPWHQWKKHAAVYSGTPDTNTAFVMAGKALRQICDAEQDEFDEGDVDNGLHNAAHIALCDPATVAALVRIARAAVEYYDGTNTAYGKQWRELGAALVAAGLIE